MVNVKTLFLPEKANLKEAIKIINTGPSQIALVVDEEEVLIGTITDGDIRRGLLKGYDLHSSVRNVMKREFCSLPENATQNKVVQLMIEKNFRQMPLVDSRGHVTRIHLMNDLLKPDELKNSVVIMAGGEGHRLRPLTDNCPKPMLRIGDKPMLEIILEQCIEAGFRNFNFSVNYLKNQVIDYFKDGSSWGVDIQYLEEIFYMGTAGSLSLLNEIPEHPFIVLNGDILTHVNYSKLLRSHISNNALATICTRKHETVIPFGVIHNEGEIALEIEEKPVFCHNISAGIYVLDPVILQYIVPNKKLDMPQILQKSIIEKHSVQVFPVHEYWLDIGHPEIFDQVVNDWGKKYK